MMCTPNRIRIMVNNLNERQKSVIQELGLEIFWI